ncbi:hypothetical protein AM1_2427 [Acaryochloris marina MBIC11017]|uniref:Uncharacterized protein n=1 Tax=Acaryochloris marina (strain MBIC 11017) TaxID=329726 RepID=B0C444_ACAM1|nr:hypothetical protein AM1_2427 [Acaryochloris marina MBIC11017]
MFSLPLQHLPKNYHMQFLKMLVVTLKLCEDKRIEDFSPFIKVKSFTQEIY